MTISNQPPKGTKDWLPEEFRIRKYIFDTWREVCTRFGYEEYLTPIVEDAAVYRAKSGEDIGGKELMTMTDRAGRELAIRPEMTPSVTRMVTQIYQESPKPLRLFSIANFMRNEKPQRGRNREFWQLNFDNFGSDSINADIEILQMALEIMLAFKPPKDSFVLYINNRKLIDGILSDIAKVTEEQRTEVVRTLDKFEKLTQEEFKTRLKEIGLNDAQVLSLEKFITSKSGEELIANIPSLVSNQGYVEIIQIIESLTNLGYSEWFSFQPNIIRGFDYYDGMVFEVFDKNPENNRSMFGGGRYNGLARIFGSELFPAVGSAPGDETTRIFLESWGLLESIKEKVKSIKTYIPLIDGEALPIIQKLAQKLRKEGQIIEVGFELERIGKSLEYANKKGIDKVILIGQNELLEKKYVLKNMKTGEQENINL